MVGAVGIVVGLAYGIHGVSLGNEDDSAERTYLLEELADSPMWKYSVVTVFVPGIGDEYIALPRMGDSIVGIEPVTYGIQYSLDYQQQIWLCCKILETCTQVE